MNRLTIGGVIAFHLLTGTALASQMVGSIIHGFVITSLAFGVTLIGVGILILLYRKDYMSSRLTWTHETS